MKFMATIKYYTRDIVCLTYPIYYAVVFLLYLTGFLLTKIFQSEGRSDSISINSLILVLVLGLTMTRKAFRTLTQIGISRKTQFLGMGTAIIILSFMLTVIDRIFDLFVMVLFERPWFYINNASIVKTFFEPFVTELNPIWQEGLSLLFSFSLHILIFAAAVFVAMLYVRMNTIFRVSVSVGVPILCFIGLPVFVLNFPQAACQLWDTITVVFGAKSGNPLLTILSCTVLAILIYGFYVLLIRRAPIKD